jgi:hypothetical protein
MEITQPVISYNPDDAGTPGVMVEFSAGDAERMGCFEEDALNEAVAWASNADLALDTVAEQ